MVDLFWQGKQRIKQPNGVPERPESYWWLAGTHPFRKTPAPPAFGGCICPERTAVRLPVGGEHPRGNIGRSRRWRHAGPLPSGLLLRIGLGVRQFIRLF